MFEPNDEFAQHSPAATLASPQGAERLELWRAYSVAGAGEPIPKVKDATLVGSFRKNPMIAEREL